MDALEDFFHLQLKNISKQHSLVAKTNCKQRFYSMMLKDLQVEWDYNEEIYDHCNCGIDIYQPIDYYFKEGFSTLELWWNN